MMKMIFALINRRLWIKVLIPVSFCVLLVMGISLWFSIQSQNRFGQNQLNIQNDVLAKAVEGGMFDALAIGENDTVRSQFKRLNEKVKNLKVYVYDFNRVVSFSTDKNSVGKSMDGLAGPAAVLDISEQMSSGKSSDKSLEMNFEGMDYVIKNEPILNEKKCFHCHGSKREVLGGISVLSSMTAMKNDISHNKNISIIIFAAGLCLIIFFVWIFFFFLVNKKVALVLTAASNLRQKDFTQEYQVKKGDEINHILSRINIVTQELRSTIAHIVENSSTLALSSQNMTKIADILDASSAEASERSANVSAAAEEMSANNSAIASAMDEATQTMNTLASAVEEMTVTVGEIAKNSSESKMVIDKVVESFGVILSAVGDLGVRADDVDEVTNEIRSISEQVSLLALNAKIEAARAGEAGKGFAVVAQEITELASDTSQSTVEADEKLAGIKTMVTDLIAQVSGLSKDVKSSDQAISGIAAAVEEQNATTMEIARNINDVSSKISDVNHRVTQGAQTAAEIAQDISGVEQVSSKVQTESHTLNTGASELASMAEAFKNLMKQFKI